MNIRLHNKFEILYNNKTITAYNTLLNTVFDKIGSLSQYTSHLALGLGKEQRLPTDSKLGQYALSFECTTEEIQSDVTKDTLYIKKSVVIPENNETEFSFCELGLTDSGDFDPVIYNHVLLKDTAGQVVTINRKKGEALEIKVTIYLELSTTGKGLFIKGENNLIKQILGEKLELSDTNLYACRGENLTGNEYTTRVLPKMDNAVVCDKEITKTDSGLDITFKADMGVGVTEELVLVYGNQSVLRINTLETKAPKSVTTTLTSLNGNVLELGENVKEVTSVKCGEEAETSYTLTRYASKLTDKIENLFDQPFTSSTKRYVSRDQSMIAFIYQSQVHLYRATGYGFEKLNTTQMPASDIMKMFIFSNKILMLMTTSPYFRIFDIDGNNVISRGVDLTFYQTSIYPYSWIDADATVCDDGKIILGLIINNEEHTPVIMRFNQNVNTTYYDSIEKPKSVGALKVFALGKTPYNEPLVAFVTDNYLGEELYAIEEFFESSSALGDSEKAYTLVNDSLEIKAAGRAVMSQYELSPYLRVYYFPTLIESPTHLSTGKKHYVSGDGNYIIAVGQDDDFKIYNFHNPSALEEFAGGFPEFFNKVDAKDFEFVGHMLLVFTLSSVYGIVLKESMIRLDNVKNSQASYDVEMKTYDLLGSKELEGVRLELKLTFADDTKPRAAKAMYFTKYSSLGDERVEN